MKKKKIKAYFKLLVTSYSKSLPMVKIFYTLLIEIKATTETFRSFFCCDFLLKKQILIKA